MFRSRMLSLLALTAALAACADGGATAPEAGAVPDLAVSMHLVGIRVTPRTATLAPGGTVALTRRFTDVAGTLLTLETTAPAWTSLSPAVAKVSASGVVTALAAGSARIVANQWGMYADTAVVTVQAAAPAPTTPAPTAPAPTAPAPTTPAPSQPAAASNEPAGFLKVTERGFAAFLEDGWHREETGYPNFILTTDPTAPKSGANVLRIRYPVGMTAGVAPGTAERNMSSLGYTKLYHSFWMKLSDNFKGNISSTNKIFHYWVGGGNRVFISAEGRDYNTLRPTMRLQGTADGREYLTPNLDPSAQFVRGRWHKVEVLMTVNAPGVRNATIQWWLDGKAAGKYTDVQIMKPGEAASPWQIVQLSPTWGGGGENITVEQNLWLDHLYVSGAR